MSQTKRLKWIDAQIRANRYPNAHTVAEEFEISPRVTYKDRCYLIEQLGAPLKTDRQRGGWYYTDPTFHLPNILLTDTEAITLRRSLLAAEEYLSQTDADALRQIAAKLQTYMPPRLSHGHERMRGSVHPAVEISSRLASDCSQAVQNRQRLHILYYSVRRNEIKERIIQPYELLVWRGEPHLIAYCEWRCAMRQFFLGRIKEWKLLPGDRAFVPDPDFDIEAYLQRGLDLQHGEEMVTVKVRFSPYQARWIRERRYHASQVTEEQADGGLILTLCVAGTEEVRRWLLGYGAEAEVLEPEVLLAEIAAETKKLQKIYGPFPE